MNNKTQSDGSNTRLSLGRRLRFLFVLSVVIISVQVVAQEGDGIADVPMTGKLTGATLILNATSTRTFTPGLEQSYAIKNVITLNVNEETPLYIPGNFEARVKVKIEYGHLQGTPNTINDQILTVSYNKDAGGKYNARNYFHFGGAEYVKITVIEAPTLVSGSIGSLNLTDLLTVDNEMRVTRFYELATTLSDLAPASLNHSAPGAGADELPITWSWLSSARNTHTQLEWVWVEGDLLTEYMDANGNVDYDLLFKTGATRVDLEKSRLSYEIPLLYGGSGKVYFRLRPVVIKKAGLRTDGPWSAVQSEPFSGHNASLNWQSTITYAEEGKRKAVIQYYDGSLRSRQTVTKDNSTKQTVVAETLYDGEGRPAVQILPTPGMGNIIAYTANLNQFNSQTDNTNPADFFDLEPIATPGSGTPGLQTTKGTSKYYSPSNTTGNPYTPDAEGYPYTVTRFTPDGTGRIMTQSGVGAALKMGSGHETKYYYGSPSQEQLYGLFGTEVGNKTHYFKNMVQDANGQMSVSYVDMHGRTVATALAGDAPSALQTLNKNQYPNQAGSYITQNLLDANVNVVKNNSIEAINTILVPAYGSYDFSYKLAPDKLQLKNCTNLDICYDCLYDLEITITDESGDRLPIIRRLSNVSLNPTDNCSPGSKNLTLVQGTATVSAGVITFSESLSPGSYAVRKTLTISEGSLKKQKDLYLIAGKGLCKTEQDIIDSVYAVMKADSKCDQPSTLSACEQCNQALGDLITYKNNYLASLGLTVATASPDLIKEIEANFKSAKQACDQLCGSSSQTLASKRLQMLQDMMPYTGQYATEFAPSPQDGISMFTAYNIFSTGGSYQQPFYKSPLKPDGTPNGSYLTSAGTIDPTIQLPVVLTPDEFTQQFNPSWAAALLPHHPEFGRLKFAEDNLQVSYNWNADFSNTLTYTAASSKGFLFTSSNFTDPFFDIDLAHKVEFRDKVTIDYVQGLSMWQIAYGDAVCKNIIGKPQRDLCYQNAPKVPPFNTNIITGASLSSDEKDQLWNVFNGIYAAERDNYVNAYIAVNAPLSDATTLVNEKYFLRFPENNNQLAAQIQNFDPGSGSWYVPTGSTTPPPVATGASATATYGSRCDSYIDQWKQTLLQCPALDGLDPVTKTTVLNQITTGMAEVCKKGSDAANPYGSSNVAPATPNDGTPRSFEDVINAVFNQNGLNIQTTNLCNPFVIEFPKPYGKNPVMVKEIVTVIDTCMCNRFATLKNEALSNERDPAVLSSFNEYLYSAYGEVMTEVLYNELTQNCGTAAYDNSLNGVFPLSSPQPMPEFLKCGFSGDARCITCARLSAFTQEFKQLIPSTFNGGPFFSNADLTADQVRDNILWTKFINYRTGFQFNWLDYAKKATETGCNLANYSNNSSATQTVICRDAKALTDPGPIVQETPCDKVKRMAVALGQQLYQQRIETLLAEFEAAYRTKCLAAKDIEEFSVGNNTSEYHYTLYYYDQAGSLVKTVPPAGVRPDFSTTFLQQVKAAVIAGTLKAPAHLMATNYRFNSLNGVVAQNSPDANKSEFWYDLLGRLAVSQNAQQRLDGTYSYTRYDDLGRITEVGQKAQSQPMTQSTSQDKNLLRDWILNSGGARTQITQTVYDFYFGYGVNPPVNILAGLMEQQNLRNRVSYTLVKNNAADQDYYTASFYTYDVHGNVGSLVQDYKGVTEVGTANRFKLITYDYDLISGKVNAVNYQSGQSDAFYHCYKYDDENRITKVLTSRDAVYWEQDAQYSYYLHGPLQRTVLGQQQVQGIDYAYTLQGWLKGVNATNLDPSFDMGKDGLISGTGVPPVARDAFSYALDFYGATSQYTDYKPINSSKRIFANAAAAGFGFKALFNGNIAGMGVNISKLNTPNGLHPNYTGPLLYTYVYDQLNRLVKKFTYDGLNVSTNNWNPKATDWFRENFSYDPNGNIQTLVRNGREEADAGPLFDDLKYKYYYTNTSGVKKSYDPLTAFPADFKDPLNQLAYVSEGVTNEWYEQSDYYVKNIHNQSPNNYQYDAIGNLTADPSEAISQINWTVYGKIKSINKGGNLISYTYDAAGNRITKVAGGLTTLYVRDASGNVMSVYTAPTSTTTLRQVEAHLYGTSRMGIAQEITILATNSNLDAGFSAATNSYYTRGEKNFELSNHLGNVLTTLSDKKRQHTANNTSIDYYNADVLYAQDYYAFGMQMAGGRKWQIGNKYRYGFNGKENDNDVKGDGNQQDYGMRIYDPRLGRFLSVDPLTKDYPMLTPYQFASNSPLSGIDLDGLEFYYAADGTLLGSIGKSTQVRVVDDKYLKSAQGYIAWANGTKIDQYREDATNGVNKISRDAGLNNEELNTRALLTTIRYAENAKEGVLGYDKLYGGGTFKGKDLNKDGKVTEAEKFADHPRQMITAYGYTMDVAGAYQFKSSRWDDAKRKLGLKDFSPANQDQAALQLIRWQEQDNPRAKGVIENIRIGKIGLALGQLNGTWTSLPDGKERQMWFKEALDFFKKAISNELSGKSEIATPKGGLKL